MQPPGAWRIFFPRPFRISDGNAGSVNTHQTHHIQKKIVSNMKNVSDQELLNELKNRFDRNQQVMREQHELLSQLEKINARLVQSERVQSAFLSNIRNEINNPLTSIIGLSRDMTT